MRTIIAGGRTFTNQLELYKAILLCGWEITEVVCGCAPGVDSMGEEWAKNAGLPVKRFPADWKKYGKSAGPRRNEEMAEYGEALIALWDYASRGTAHMIETAKRKGRRVYIHRITP